MSAFSQVFAGIVASPFEPIDTGGDVPEGATAHFSFAQDTYWTEADGDLAATDIISGVTHIEDGVGYTGGVGSSERLIGPAVDVLSSNMTVVVRGRIITTNPAQAAQSNGSVVSMADSEDFNSGFEVGVDYVWDEAEELVTSCRGQVNVYDDSQSFITLGATARAGTSEPEARFDTAYTLTPTAVSLSTMGDAVVTQAVTASFTVGWVELVRADFISGSNVHIAVESFTVYPAQLDAALPALSTPL